MTAIPTRQAIRPLFHTLVATLLCLATVACGDDEGYRLKATIADGSDATFRLVTYTPDGPVTRLLASRKGVFEHSDTVASPTLVEVLANDYTPLGMYWAENGTEIEITIDPKSMAGFKVEGGEVNGRLNNWFGKNKTLNAAGPSAALNAVIEQYVRDHRDDVVSAILMVTRWDASVNPALTAELWSLISAKAKPAGIGADMMSLTAQAVQPGATEALISLTFVNQADTLETYRPTAHTATIIAFSDETVANHRDSLVATLKGLRHDWPDMRRLKVIDYSLDTDTLTWRRTTRRDSADYTRAWSGAGRSAIGVAELGIARLPYYIVTDSAGSQIYRGTSVTDADQAVRRLLNDGKK